MSGVELGFLGAEMEVGAARKSSPEAFESLKDDLKIKMVDFHETIDNSMKIVDFSSPVGHSGAQICFQEARNLREKELEGPESELREKKNQKKRE